METTSNTFNFFEVSTHPILGHKFAGNIRAPLENFTTIIYKYYCRKHSSYISWKKGETLIVQVSTPLELPWPLPAELFHQNLKFLFFPMSTFFDDDDNFQILMGGWSGLFASFFVSRRRRCLPRKLILLSINILIFHFFQISESLFSEKQKNKSFEECVYFTFCEAKERPPSRRLAQRAAGWVAYKTP